MRPGHLRPLADGPGMPRRHRAEAGPQASGGLSCPGRHVHFMVLPLHFIGARVAALPSRAGMFTAAAAVVAMSSIEPL